MSLAIEVGIAKINKYASRESGDTAEVVERPGGGVSVVVVDGQGTGAAAKALSTLLTAKAIALIKDGVRDGAVARAVHDTLYAYRSGRVSASLDIVSVDLRHKHVVLTRNASAPAVVVTNGEAALRAPEQGPIGIYPFTKPGVICLPFAPGLQIWVVTDGVTGAGKRYGVDPFDLLAVTSGIANGTAPAMEQAEQVLQLAMAADRGRPNDDMTVATLRVVERAEGPDIRRLSLDVPVAQ